MAAINVYLIKDAKLPSLDQMTEELKLPEFGAVACFQGITRNNFNGKQVKTLFYEGYESMAIKELHKLSKKAVEDFHISGISICHRLGEVVSYRIIK